jgi:hypothetical protein
MDGFWAKTDSGLFQIDGSTLNFSLRAHFVATTSKNNMPVGSTNGFPPNRFAVSADSYIYTFTATNPIIALWTSDANAPVTVIYVRNTGGNTWEAFLWAWQPTSFEVFLFDQTPAITAGANFGLKIWNPSGQLIADATVPMLNPFAWHDDRTYGQGWKVTGSPGEWNQDWSDRSRQKIAVGGIKCGAYAANINFGAAYVFLSCWHMDPSGGCFFHWKAKSYGGAGSQPNATYFGEALAFSAILIDVSNFS